METTANNVLNNKQKPTRSKVLQQANVEVVSNTEILQTLEYNVFTFDVHNRPISEEKVNGFIKKFKNGHNFMKEFPGIVSDNFVLLDGQHRFMACRYLGIPFIFRFADRLSISNVVEVQSNAGWSNTDYLHAFVSQGKQDYVIVQRFINKYKVPTSVAIRLLSRGSTKGGLGRSGFYDGTFKVKTEEYAHNVCELALRFSQLGWKYPFDRNFIMALATVIKHPDFDEKRMLDKVKQFGASLLNRQVKTELAVRNLEEVFNYHAAEKHRVRFS